MGIGALRLTCGLLPELGKEVNVSFPLDTPGGLADQGIPDVSGLVLLAQGPMGQGLVEAGRW